MLNNYLNIAIRRLRRNGYYTTLHIVGLGVAIACGLFIYQFISFHKSYDDYHTHAPKTYKLVSDLLLEKTSYNEGASYAIYEALKTKVAGVGLAAFAMVNQDFTIRINGQLFTSEKKGAFASPAWFKLFDFRWLAGRPEDFGRPNTVVLRKSAALQYFGESNPVGKIIEVNNVPVEVVGILDDNPLNTSLTSAFYLSESSIKNILGDIRDNFFSDWGYLNSTNQVYISLNKGISVKGVEDILQHMTNEAFGEKAGKLYKFSLIPLPELHLNGMYGGTMRPSLLRILGLIGCAILLMAILNYASLSIAEYARRHAEIGTRKVLGSSRFQLFLQVTAESLLVSSIAMLVGIGLTATAIPLANRYLFLAEPIAFIPAPQLLSVCIAGWLLIGLSAGIYPALVISRMQVLRAMRRQVTFENTLGRKAIVVLQNTLSLGLICAAIIVMKQVHYMRHTDIGFDRESVLIFPLPKGHTNDGHWRTFLDSQPHVISYSYCFLPPAGHDGRGSTLRFSDRQEFETWSAKTTLADSAYLRTFGIPIVAGRNFRTAAASPEFLINETMSRQLGFEDPREVLGKSLWFGGINDDPGTIVGVTGDYNTHDLREAIRPTVIGHNGEMMRSVAIKFNGKNVSSLVTGLEQQWKSSYPDDVLKYDFLDSRIERLYQAESVLQYLIWTASFIAVLISCLGLLGLISLAVQRRTKEIGIRKVLGASVAGLVTLLSEDFLKLVFIATIIAIPVIWWVMTAWLDDFAYRIQIRWWMFALAGGISIVIAFLTIGTQAIRAAIANPVDSLRTE